jgi:hypothetical protein
MLDIPRISRIRPGRVDPGESTQDHPELLYLGNKIKYPFRVFKGSKKSTGQGGLLSLVLDTCYSTPDSLLCRRGEAPRQPAPAYLRGGIPDTYRCTTGGW